MLPVLQNKKAAPFHFFLPQTNNEGAIMFRGAGIDWQLKRKCSVSYFEKGGIQKKNELFTILSRKYVIGS